MSSAWVSSLAKISVLGTSVRPGKISVKSLSRKVRTTVRIWSGATTSRSSWSGVGEVLVELLPARLRGSRGRACPRRSPASTLEPRCGDRGADAVDVVVDVDAVGHGLLVGVFHDQVLVEEAEGLLGGRGGEADEVGVEVFEHLPPEVVDGAVAFVGDDDVEGLDGDGRVVVDRARVA